MLVSWSAVSFCRAAGGHASIGVGGVGGYEGEEVVDVPGSEETEKSQRRALEVTRRRRCWWLRAEERGCDAVSQ